MSLPTYKEIANLIDTKVVPPEKKPTRTGIRKFLMRAAVLKPLSPPSTPSWYRLWKQIEWARYMALSLRVEIPAALWEEDRARLRAKIAATYDVRFEDEKEVAQRWAQRPSSPHS